MTRLLTLGYGLTAYGIFLLTAIHAFGFTCAVSSPLGASVDTADIRTAALVDFALLVGFVALMLGLRWKPLRAKLGSPVVARSTVILATCVGLMTVLHAWQPIGINLWTASDPVLVIGLYTLFAFGWALVIVSIFLVNHFDVFGLRHLWALYRGRPVSRPAPLDGALANVRPPLFVGGLLALWSTPMMSLAQFLVASLGTVFVLSYWNREFGLRDSAHAWIRQVFASTDNEDTATRIPSWNR
ncbi:MAG: hypothetical protein AAF493_22365 [Pseudomonadota bacterium]